MKRSLYALVLLLLFVGRPGKAQEQPKELSLAEVMAIVKTYHPVAKQAAINVQQRSAAVTSARGAFDPVLENSYANKTFDGTEYYNYHRPALVIPTWFGIEVSTGLEYLAGSRTNPEETTGKTSYAGLSIPLAKNLLMDKRRAALQTAKIYRQAAPAEQRNMLNDLLLDAGTAYWDWVYRYQVLQLVNNAVAVNEQRLQLTRTAFNIGERPAIDTTEALSQLQGFQLQQSQAVLAFQNAVLELSLYLWAENETPYTLPMGISPAQDLLQQAEPGNALPELNALLAAAEASHPELVLYRYKMEALEVERRLKLQELLPKIDLKYNQLGKGYNIGKTAFSPLLENNYQYGISVGIPLRFSYGRGEYRTAKLKILSTNLQRMQKGLQVQNKVKAYFNELLALRRQFEIQQQVVENLQTLQRGEEIRYQNGESSLFLINSRETKALEAAQKLLELSAKFYKTKNTLGWAAGTLAD